MKLNKLRSDVQHGGDEPDKVSFDSRYTTSYSPNSEESNSSNTVSTLDSIVNDNYLDYIIELYEDNNGLGMTMTAYLNTAFDQLIYHFNMGYYTQESANLAQKLYFILSSITDADNIRNEMREKLNKALEKINENSPNESKRYS